MPQISDGYMYRLAREAVNNLFAPNNNNIPHQQQLQPDPIFDQNEMPMEVGEDFDYQNQAFSDVGSEGHSDHDDNDSLIYFSDNLEIVESSTEEEEENIDGDSHTIREKLQNWACQFQVHGDAINALLRILKNHNCFRDLPIDSRTLKKTSRTVPTRRIEPGEYVHFGFQTGAKKVVENFQLEDSISIHVNVDGIPLGKSGSQLWPIQVHILQAPTSDPFIVGMWEGKGKPNDFNEFMTQFTNEMKEYVENGIEIGGALFDFKIESFCCDAPARASLSYIKGHNAYYGCNQCIQRGTYYQDRVVFSRKIAELRQDEDFFDPPDNHHHTGESILNTLNFGLVTGMPYEYQHLVCLGVMRKLLYHWTKGSRRYKLSQKMQDSVSEHLLKIQNSVPQEFARKPRSLRVLERWKATEFRQFLCYTGPVVLKSVLKDAYYAHFMKLHVSIIILAHPENHRRYNEYASFLLTEFVGDFQKMYGRQSLSYNVHGLLHLSSDSLKHGPLDRYSTFRFENNLQKVKRLKKAYAKPLQQIAKRLQEMEQCSQPPIKRKYTARFPHSEGPRLTSPVSQQFKFLDMEDFVIRLKPSDNIIMLKSGRFVKVENIIQTREHHFIIIGRKFLRASRFYSNPCDSTEFGISKVANDMGELREFSTNQINSKCVAIPYRETELIIFPLIHCFSI